MFRAESMISPPFCTFAGCRSPFLRDSRHFRVCRIRESFFSFFFYIRSSLGKKVPKTGMSKEEK